MPEGSELEFRSLDQPSSRKKYILLVQVGKEGWNCPSLTGVILSQKGDSPKNMVLQTSCRCLRQVDRDKEEKALIWLNEYNAKVLNEQLQKEQHTSIEEINRLKKGTDVELVSRHSRMDFLELPLVDFYQLKVNYQSVDEEEKPNTKEKLKQLFEALSDYQTSASIQTGNLGSLHESSLVYLKQTGYDFANFNQWLYDLSKSSYSLISVDEFQSFHTELSEIFETITYSDNDMLFWNDIYDRFEIESRIRQAFSIKRTLQTSSEVVPEDANLLVVEKLKDAEKNEKLYPSENDVRNILVHDKKPGTNLNAKEEEIKKAYEVLQKNLEEQGMGNMVPAYETYKANFADVSLPVRQKDKTLHYLPYNFGGVGASGFEKSILENLLRLETFQNKELEVYYNGERGITEFVIKCYAKEGKYWKNIGRYTTDFLIIQRKNKKKIHKALMVETKGEGYKHDEDFKAKRKFVETEFLQQNNDKFGYERFDFLYLEDSADLDTNLNNISKRIDEFFKD